MSDDTREDLAAYLEWLAAQVREHGVLPEWESDIHAESVKSISPCGRFINRVPSGRNSYTVKFDIDRSAAWRNEELNRV